MVKSICLSACVVLFFSVAYCDEQEPHEVRSLVFEESEAVCASCCHPTLYGLNPFKPSHFPKVTHWYTARVRKSRVVKNSISVPARNDQAWFDIWPVGADRQTVSPRSLELKYDAYAFEYKPDSWGYIGLTKSGQLFATYFLGSEDFSPQKAARLTPRSSNERSFKFSYKKAIGLLRKQNGLEGYAVFPVYTAWFSAKIDSVTATQNPSGKPDLILRGRMWKVGSDVNNSSGQPFEIRDVDEWTQENIKAGLWGFVGLTPSGRLFNAHFPAEPPDGDSAREK